MWVSSSSLPILLKKKGKKKSQEGVGGEDAMTVIANHEARRILVLISFDSTALFLDTHFAWLPTCLGNVCL